jgi:hypothetical protein
MGSTQIFYIGLHTLYTLFSSQQHISFYLWSNLDVSKLSYNATLFEL